MADELISLDTLDRPTSRRAVRFVLLAVLVAGTIVAVYQPVLPARALLFDDDQYLIENRLVQRPSWQSARRFFTEVLAPSTVRGYYQPLAMISLMLDCAAGGTVDNLVPFRLTSLLLHAANSILVMVFLYLLFRQVAPAAMAGLLYGLSPTTIEAVAWISERKTVLATLFGLWCLVFYLLYIRRRNWWWYVPCAAAFVLSLLSKPALIGMPILLLLLDFWPLRRLGGKAVLEKLPLFFLAAVSAVVTYLSQSTTAAVRLPHQAGPLRIILMFCHNIIFYPRNFFRPTGLTWYYPFPQPFDLSNHWVLFTVVGTAVLLAVLAISLRWTRALAASWLFFFVAVLPTLGVIGFHPVIAADRHIYFPALGFLMAPAYFAGKLWSGKLRPPRAIAARVAMTAAVVVAATLQSVLVRKYLQYWQDSEKLYKYMLRRAPDVVVLHNNLANFLGDKGKLEEAVWHFQRSLQLKPGSPEVHNNLGNVLRDLGRIDQAIEHYHKALRLRPNFAVAHYNLAGVLAQQGHTEQAIEHYRRALAINDEYVRAWAELGLVLAGQGRLAEAVECYRRAIELQPDFIVAHGRLGLALARLGKTDDAIEQFRIVLKARPNDHEMHFNIGYLLEQQGRLDQALQHYRRALEIKPDYARARRRYQLLQSGGQNR